MRSSGKKASPSAWKAGFGFSGLGSQGDLLILWHDLSCFGMFSQDFSWFAMALDKFYKHV